MYVIIVAVIGLFFSSAMMAVASGGLDKLGSNENGLTQPSYCRGNECLESICQRDCVAISKSNCHYPDNLEITVVNVGQGDATLIATPSQLVLADLGESHWNSHADADQVAATIAQQYGEQCKTIDYFINSHFHLDHIGYLRATYSDNNVLLSASGAPIQEGQNLHNPEFLGGIGYLVDHHGFVIKTSIFRDFKRHNPNRPTAPPWKGSKTYWNWRHYLASPEGKEKFNPITAEFGKAQARLTDIEGVPVTIDIIQIDAATPSFADGCDPATYFGSASNTAREDTSTRDISASENDLSIAFVLGWGHFQMFIGGDTSGKNDVSGFNYAYHDTESCMVDDPYIATHYGGKIEVYRVNHHGSAHSSNQQFIDLLDPKVSVFSVGDHNPYNHVNDHVLRRIIQKSVTENKGAVYLTERGINEGFEARYLVHTYIGDDEAPLSYEGSEVGDASISISVSDKGRRFVVRGKKPSSKRTFSSR